MTVTEPQLRPRATTATVAVAVQEGWTPNELFRLCIVEYPRRFHARTPQGRADLVRDAPRITNTVWDAAIGASIEHACLAHGCEPPEWTDQEDRFLESAKRLLRSWCDNVACHLPAPFTRRGVLLDARELDARTGDDAWRPEIGHDERWPLGAATRSDGRRCRKNAHGQLTARACEAIEAEAVRSGWAVRIALHEDRPASTFALRAANWIDASIIRLHSDETIRLVQTGLERARLDPKSWDHLLKEEQLSKACAPVPQTVWNRPGLTIAGTAPGILEEWEKARLQSR